jgi:hypothetical protein
MKPVFYLLNFKHKLYEKLIIKPVSQISTILYCWYGSINNHFNHKPFNFLDMKTIEINLYSFDELSESAKENAINNYRQKYNYDCQFYFDEIIDSCKEVAELFEFKFGREYTDVRTSHIDDDILNLSGVRLLKYIVNNYYNDLFVPKYIKSINRELRCQQFICEVRKDYKGNFYTMLYSKLKKDNSCVLTGMGYDDDILQPVYDFLKKPDKSTTFADLLKDIENAIRKTFEDVENWVNSDEYIIDNMQANEYEFTIDGKIY